MTVGFTTMAEKCRSAAAARAAAHLCERVRGRAIRSRFRSWLTGRSSSLLDLASIETQSPVEFIHVRGVYFVPDGHHRISVARARDQEQIEAEITVWEILGTVPWEESARSGRSLPGGHPASQPA
jgi:hypothetical protein